MELQLLEDGRMALVDEEVYDIDVRSVDELAELAHRRSEGHSHRLSVGILLLTVDVAWNEALLAESL